MAKLHNTPPSKEGWIQTLNQMGYMIDRVCDPFTKEFVEFSTKAPGPSLEIGAAYGIVSLEVLNQGAHVIANDLDPRHLDILKENVSPELQSNLELCPGRFPSEIDFPKNSIGSVLISRVLHFFTGKEIQESAHKVFSWLAPGGKVFVVSETPYTGYFTEFAPTYEKRKAKGESWPGFIENLKEINQSRASSLPNQMHCLDPEVLSRAFKEAGFVIEKANFFSRPEFPQDIRLNGREGVGLVARKVACATAFKNQL